MMRFWSESWLCGPGSYFHGPLGMFVNLALWIIMIFLVVWLFQAVISKKNFNIVLLAAGGFEASLRCRGDRSRRIRAYEKRVTGMI